MPVQELSASGIDAINLATQLLQRNRLADPYAGVFEAADIQWTWRTPRESENKDKRFWLDDHGPVAGIWHAGSRNHLEVVPIVIPHTTSIEAEAVWARCIEFFASHPYTSIDVPVADDDIHFHKLALDSSLVPADRDFTGWITASAKPDLANIAEGFTLVDRTLRDGTPHPMSERNGEHIAERLKQCSLYDPLLDLTIESPDGQPAGYSLYWFDPVSRVGLIEPVRVHDGFRRKGLARAMVTHGIHRLVAKGAERLKVSWETEAAGALYQDVGFELQSTTTWYSSQPSKKA